jgi:hypothetical protein
MSNAGPYETLICAPASPAAEGAMASTSVPMALMIPLSLGVMSAAW